MPEIPGGYAQANWQFTGAGLPNGAEFTMGLNVGTYSNPPSTAAEDVGVAFLPVIGNLTADVELINVHVKFGPQVTGPSGDFGFANPGTGGGVGASPNVAYLVHKVTALGGRAGRGRFYLPGVGEGQIDEKGALGAAFLSALQTDLDTFYGNLISLDLEPVVLHEPDSPITLPTAITSFVADATAATQRRRMRR